MYKIKIINLLILKNIIKDKFLSIFSIIGIALAIGLFVGVILSSNAAISEFEKEIRGIGSFTNYQITNHSGIDFDEDIYEKIFYISQNSFPVIKTIGYLPKDNEIIDINGVMIVKVIKFVGDMKENKIDIESLYRDLNSVLITKKFSDKNSINLGDVLHVVVYDKMYPLKVAGIIADSSLSDNTFVMDIGNFQEYFGKVGLLSKIELNVNNTELKKINEILPQELKLESKEEVLNNKSALVSSFRQNLRFVSFISILVGIFLLYNTIFISVVKRRTEIGILRGLGAQKQTILGLFVIQGLILGMIGSLIGIFLGQIIAKLSLKIIEKTLITMYTPIVISELTIKTTDIFLSLLIGILISLIASVIPAYEATRIRPNETMREGTFEIRFRKYNTLFLFIGLLFFFLGLFISYYDYIKTPCDFPLFSYTGILLIIIGFTLISPFYLSFFLKIIKKPFEIFFRFNGRITISDIKGNTYRFSIALISVAISCALIISILILIYSLRSSLKGWINKNIVADVYIKPSSCISNYCFFPISNEVIDIIRDYPEVAGIDRFRALNIDFMGKKVIAGFADIAIKRKYYTKRYFEEEYDKVLREMEGKEQVVTISQFLALKYGFKVGDTVNLMTPQGSKEFKIIEISSSYSTTSGFLYFDRKWLKKFWNLDDTTQFSVYIKDGVDLDAFINKIKKRLMPYYSLEIMNNKELRDKIMIIFNRSFAITYAIEIISIFISIIGLVNTLIALVFERKREISIMRYLGSTWEQIEKNFILTSGIISVLGLVLGTFTGFLISLIFINVVNKISFGWEIHLHIPYIYILIVIGILFFSSLLAGYFPSKVARKIDPKSFVTFE